MKSTGKLVELFNERSKCALELGKLSSKANLPLYQPDREKEVLENAEQNNKGRSPMQPIRRLFERHQLTKPAPPSVSPCIATRRKSRHKSRCTR